MKWMELETHTRRAELSGGATRSKDDYYATHATKGNSGVRRQRAGGGRLRRAAAAGGGRPSGASENRRQCKHRFVLWHAAPRRVTSADRRTNIRSSLAHEHTPRADGDDEQPHMCRVSCLLYVYAYAVLWQTRGR